MRHATLALSWLLILLAAPVAQAQVPWQPPRNPLVERLRSEERFTQAELDAAVTTLAGGELFPLNLERLLDPASPRRAQIVGARVVERRADPALAGLAMRSFLLSEAASLEGNPDVSERLLQTLQRMPWEEVRPQLEGLYLPELIEAAGQKIYQRALGPTSGFAQPPVELGPELRAVAGQLTRDWFTDLAAAGPEGLALLTNDSNQLNRILERRLEALFVAQLMGDPDPAARRLAWETATAHGLVSPQFEPFRLAGLESEDDELRGWAGSLEPFSETDRIEFVGNLYPFEDHTGLALQGRYLHRPGGVRIPDQVLWLGSAGLLLGLWIFLVWRFPRQRKWWFRGAALAAGPLFLVGLEGALALMSVDPPYLHGPTFSPNQAPDQLFEVWQKDGAQHAEVVTRRTRYRVIPRVSEEFRVVTLGASSTFGTNYVAEDAWPAVVERRLDERGRPTTVINAGVTGALTDDLLHYVPPLLDFQPDLLVLYAGYNDFTYLPELARFQAYDPRSMALSSKLSELRMATVLRQRLSVGPQLEQLDEFGAYLDEHDLSDMDRSLLWSLTRNNLRRNLGAMIDRARAAGVPVLLVMQPQNQVRCLQAGDARVGGSCSLMTLRELYWDLAAEEGVAVVDPQQALSEVAEGAPAGDAFFYDNIHLTRLGNEVVGAAVADAVEALWASD